MYRLVAALLVAGLPAAAQPARPGVDAPELAALGPYGVGLATLRMGGRMLAVDVWYPARAGAGPAITYHSGLVGQDGRPAAFSVPGIAVGRRTGSIRPLSARHPGARLRQHAGGARLAGREPGHQRLRRRRTRLRRPAEIRRPQRAIRRGAPGDRHRRRGRDLQRRAATGDAILSHADPARTALIGYSMGGYGVLASAGAQLDPGLAKATGGALAGYVAGGPKANALRVSHLKAVVAISPATHIGPLALFAPGAFAAITVPTLPDRRQPGSRGGLRRGARAVRGRDQRAALPADLSRGRAQHRPDAGAARNARPPVGPGLVRRPGVEQDAARRDRGAFHHGLSRPHRRRGWPAGPRIWTAWWRIRTRAAGLLAAPRRMARSVLDRRKRRCGRGSRRRMRRG